MKRFPTLVLALALAGLPALTGTGRMLAPRAVAHAETSAVGPTLARTGVHGSIAGKAVAGTRLAATLHSPANVHTLSGAYPAAATASREQARAAAGRVQAQSLMADTLGSLPLGWTTYLGDPSDSHPNGITTDSQGNRFVTGASTSGNTFVSNYDPAGRIRWTTRLQTGGGGGGRGIAVDGQGNVYVIGATDSTDFPVSSGAAQTTLSGGQNAFVASYDPSGTLRWATYLGGSGGDDQGNGITVDGQNNVYVIGTTRSSDFPVSSGAAQATLSGRQNAFVASYDTGGSLRWATYLGGSTEDRGTGIGVDTQNNVYVTGRTTSSDFPITSGANQPTLGGTESAFVASYDMDGTMRWATYLGGSSNDSGSGVAVDQQSNVFVTGSATSSDFPVTAGATQSTLGGEQNAFVASYDAGGSLRWATYLGGSATETANGITVDAQGTAYVTGETSSANFPVTPGAVQPTLRGSDDAFVASYDAGGSLHWATYLGGLASTVGAGVAADGQGSVDVTGTTSSTDFPISPGAAQPLFSDSTDGFIAHLIVSADHPAALDPASPLRAGTPHARYFPETHHTLRDPALRFWDNLTGTPTLGLPLSEPFVLAGPCLQGKLNHDLPLCRQMVQVTERAVLVFTGSRVHLASLGRILGAARPMASARRVSSTANRLYFARTGHTLSGAFLRFWQTHQGSQLLGAPITEPDRETIGARVYLVQWFENGRLEAHPESPDPRYRVQPGRVGFEFLYRLGLVTG